MGLTVALIGPDEQDNLRRSINGKFRQRMKAKMYRYDF